MSEPAPDPPRAPLRPWLVVLLACVQGLAGWSLVSPHEPGAEPLPGDAVRTFVDQDATTGIDQVADPFWEERFVSGIPRAALGAAIWHRVRLDNPDPTAREVVLVAGNRRLPSAVLYVPQQMPGTFLQLSSGMQMPLSDRALPASEIAFRIQLPPRSAQYVFLRTQGEPTGAGRLALWTERAEFERAQRTLSLWQGFYLGLLTAVFAWLVIVYAVLRHADILSGSAHVLLFGGWQALQIGLDQVWFPSLAPRTAGGIESALAFLTAASLVSFACACARPPAPAAAILAALAVALAGAAPLAALAGVPGPPRGDTLAGTRDLLHALFLLAPAAAGAAALLGAIRNRPTAAVVLPLLLGALGAYTLHTRDDPPSREAGAALQMASAVPMVLLAAALGLRMRQIRREREDLQLTYTRRLEEEVRSRTAQLEEAAADLRELNGQKDRLLSIIGHDLRGPLDGVVAIARQMQRAPESFSPSELGQAAEDIAAAGQALRQTLDNLLAWARLQTGQLRLEETEVHLDSLFSALARLHAPAARSAGIEFQIHHAGLAVRGDYAALETILRNFLSNAVKFTPPGGRVRLLAAPTAGGTVIAVEDTGCGISAERLPTLFEAAPGALPREGVTGAGIGLILCAQLARRLGGTIRAFSEPGRGSRFEVTLPTCLGHSSV